MRAGTEGLRRRLTDGAAAMPEARADAGAGTGTAGGGITSGQLALADTLSAMSFAIVPDLGVGQHAVSLLITRAPSKPSSATCWPAGNVFALANDRGEWARSRGESGGTGRPGVALPLRGLEKAASSAAGAPCRHGAVEELASVTAGHVCARFAGRRGRPAAPSSDAGAPCRMEAVAERASESAWAGAAPAPRGIAPCAVTPISLGFAEDGHTSGQTSGHTSSGDNTSAAAAGGASAGANPPMPYCMGE